MKLEEVLPFVLPFARSCPDQVALHHIRLAAVEFCARTLVWNEELDPVQTDSAVKVYTLNLPEHSNLAKLRRVWIGEDDDYRIRTSRPNRQGRSIYAREVWTINRQDIEITPAPPHQRDLRVFAALKPDPVTAEEISDDLGQYITELAEGALRGILMLPNEWKDMDAAAIHGGLFNNRIGTVAAQVSRGFGDAKSQPVGRRFY